MLEAFDRVLTAMSYAAAGLAVFAIVWAGFVLMAEGADDRGGGKARAAVVMAVVGLVLVLSRQGGRRPPQKRPRPVPDPLAQRRERVEEAV